MQACDLPVDERPASFALEKRLKVIGSDEIGMAKWTGTINGQWFIGLEVVSLMSCLNEMLT